MCANGAHIGRLLAHHKVAAVAAFPHRDLALLKDLGGSLTIRGNMTNALKTEWKAFYEAAKTAKAANKKAWICVDIPDYDEAVYIPADPANIGLSAFAANSLMEQDLHFTPTGDIVYDEKPTYAEASN